MTTITYADFQANMHFYLERVFREREVIKVKDGARSFVLLGESWPATHSDNISRFGELTKQGTPVKPLRPFRHLSKAPFASR
jgi:hypothetical protein